jgi:regulator of protease activity HflC (stomatin/prohibitin superfamily)
MKKFGELSDIQKGFRVGALVVALLTILLLSQKLVEDVAADAIVVNQVPISGELQFWSQPGWKGQMFGSLTHYLKSVQVWFDSTEEHGEEGDLPVKIVFNDGANGYLSGSIRILLPTQDVYLRKIQENFGSMIDLIEDLVKPTVRKVIFSTGPLMNSFESYAAKKNDLIRYIEDQLRNGTYKTITKNKIITDELSGKEKIVPEAQLIPDTLAPGGMARQEEAPFEKYGLSIAAVSINQLDYDIEVKAQIRSQQQAQMEIQTAIAETRKQEQQAIQEEKIGQKNATKSKWEQETINAQMIAEAEKNRQVAQIEKEAAEYLKQKLILEGQGEAEKKRLIMAADGQLLARLEVYKDVNQMWATAVSNYKGNWVPGFVMGNSSGAGTNGVTDLIELLKAKTASDLNLMVSPVK